MTHTFTDEQFAALHNTLLLCNEAGIKSLILSKNQIRAAASDRQAVIVTDVADQWTSPDDTAQIAMSRIPPMVQRLSLVVGKKPTATLDLMDGKPYFKMMHVQNKSHQFDIRFADPVTLEEEVPKGFKGTPAHEFTITTAQAAEIEAAARVVGPDNIWFNISRKGMRIELVDPATGEKMSVQLSDSEEIEDPINYRYSTDIVLRMLKQKQDISCTVLTNGILRVPYKSAFDMLILRRSV